MSPAPVQVLVDNLPAVRLYQKLGYESLDQAGEHNQCISKPVHIYPLEELFFYGLLELIAIGIAYFGVIIIATHGNLFSLEFADPSGVGFALASTLVWAIFWIVHVKQETDLTVTLFLSFLFALPVLCIITYIVSPLSNVSLKGLAGATYVGVFEMGVTFVLWSAALRLSMTTAKVSSLAFTAPFLSLVIIRIVVGEQIEMATLLGLILIVAGIILQTIFSKNAKVNVAV